MGQFQNIKFTQRRGRGKKNLRKEVTELNCENFCSQRSEGQRNSSYKGLESGQGKLSSIFTSHKGQRVGGSNGEK